MGVQTMGSQGRGRQQSQFQTLARQGSLYSLTLNEVQNQLGEPLHSMNLDDLLRTVFPADGDQSLGINLETSSSRFPPASSLQRQSSMTLTQTLSKKTVDEVWRYIQQVQNDPGDERRSARERQPTLGEMTLEDFLVKAGVVAGSASDPMLAAQSFSQGVHWLQQYQPQQSIMRSFGPSRPVSQPLGVGVSNTLDTGFPDTQITMSSPMMGTLSDTQTPGRKRVAPEEIAEKTVERRQKRMIKNRESAARSRARKQAYTNELEYKVLRLEEENERLRKQKELDRLLYNAPLPEPKFRLRRTNSTPL